MGHHSDTAPARKSKAAGEKPSSSPKKKKFKAPLYVAPQSLDSAQPLQATDLQKMALQLEDACKPPGRIAPSTLIEFGKNLEMKLSKTLPEDLLGIVLNFMTACRKADVQNPDMRARNEVRPGRHETGAIDQQLPARPGPGLAGGHACGAPGGFQAGPCRHRAVAGLGTSPSPRLERTDSAAAKVTAHPVPQCRLTRLPNRSPDRSPAASRGPGPYRPANEEAGGTSRLRLAGEMQSANRAALRTVASDLTSPFHPTLTGYSTPAILWTYPYHCVNRPSSLPQETAPQCKPPSNT